MNGDIDKWLNQGVAEELAAARAASNGAPPAPATPSPPANPPTNPATSPSNPKSLSRLGIGRGGVVTSKSTKIRTQGDNPLTNPRPNMTKDPRSKSVPASDPVAEFKAANPALAAPSLFTGMDIDINKKVPVPVPAPSQEHIQTSAPPDDTVSFETTVRQLLEIAQRHPKRMVHVATKRFVLSLEIFTNPQSESPA